MTELPQQIHEVDPSRLASGSWCHRAPKTLGENDISASYNADRIAYGQPLRKPFQWRGASWVSVGNGYCRGQPASSGRCRPVRSERLLSWHDGQACRSHLRAVRPAGPFRGRQNRTAAPVLSRRRSSP
jgi:hypothetical protein